MFAHKQHGNTLLVALVMLVLLTLVAISAMTSTTQTIQTVGNAQYREEAKAAVQQAIESVVSTDFAANLSSVASSVTVTVGPKNYTVAVSQPSCTGSIELTSIRIDQKSNPSAFVTCRSSSQTQGGALYVDASGNPITPSNTLCFEQSWDVSASVSDSDTGTSVEIHQGVANYATVDKVCQ